MIFGLALLGVGAGYLLRKKSRHKQLGGTKQTTASKVKTHRVKDLVSTIRSATTLEAREELLVEMAPEVQESKMLVQNAAKKQMRLSWGALGVTVMSVFQPVLIPLGIAAVLYLSRENYKLIWRDIKRGHYLSFYLVGMVMNLGMIFSGNLILAAINGIVFGFLARITNQLEDTAQNRLVNILSENPEQVWVVKEGVEVEVDFRSLQVGDHVIVNAGEVIPVDGNISNGIGQIDQHALTGESQPVDKELGDEVFASTLLIAGRIEIEIVTAGNKTVATKITQMLEETNSYKDTIIMKGRQTGDRFVPLKLGLAALALPLLGPNSATAVMWANLGNGLGTMSPMIVMVYLQLLAKKKILVKDGRVFESLQDVDTIIFDKTGTLTEEQPTLTKQYAMNGFTETEVLRLAAAAEYRQPHPIARAILAKAEAENINIPNIDEANYELGFGIKVSIEGKTVRVGSARFLQHEGIDIPTETDVITQQAEINSHSLIYVGVNDQLAGILEMQPTIRPEAKAIVQTLQRRGVEVYIISGDHESPTRRLAEELGIDKYFAETLPENKAELVQQLKDEGRFVCFVGDGINDALALKTAHVSISMKGASTAATDTAQIIFMDGTLQRLIPLFDLVDEFTETMRRATIISFTPGTITVAGIFFLHFGIAASLLILYLNISIGLSNTLWPMIKHQPALTKPTEEEESQNDSEKPT